MKNTNLYIFINDGDVDVVELLGYNREEAFAELNRLQKSYERMQKYYKYELTDAIGNNIFTSYAS
jgi:hypothetical protein